MIRTHGSNSFILAWHHWCMAAFSENLLTLQRYHTFSFFCQFIHVINHFFSRWLLPIKFLGCLKWRYLLWPKETKEIIHDYHIWCTKRWVYQLHYRLRTNKMTQKAQENSTHCLQVVIQIGLVIHNLAPLLLTWFNSNPSMENEITFIIMCGMKLLIHS